jgi:alpha-beta hydrolase superfamily lysophospholipase
MALTVLYILLSLTALYLLACSFYFFFQERLIFVPIGNWHPEAPIMLGSEFTEHTLESSEGGSLHAIHIKARQSRGCILYFHGNTGSLVRWGPIAEELTSYGFDVFLADYRGYGRSFGPRTEELLYADALLCYKKLLSMYREDEICIYGRSLGSGMACWLAGRTNPRAVVLETPFNNMVEVANYHSRIIPVKLFLKYTFRNDVHLRGAKSPILIAHGTKDRIVPYKLGLRLYQSVKDIADTEMITIPGGRHGNLNGFPVFHQGLERFFNKYFPERKCD